MREWHRDEPGSRAEIYGVVVCTRRGGVQQRVADGTERICVDDVFVPHVDTVIPRALEGLVS